MQPAARPHRLFPGTLQVENLLLSNQGTIKLCDFGSATTISHYPDYSWSAQRRALVEEEVSVAARTPPPTVPALAGSSFAFFLMWQSCNVKFPAVTVFKRAVPFLNVAL